MRLSLTSFSHVIDSYAWIEYFKASSEGEKAKGFIEGEGSATPVIVVAEVSRKLLKEVEAGKETRDQRRRHLEFIRSSSQIIHIDFDRAAEAGEIDVENEKEGQRMGSGRLDHLDACTIRGRESCYRRRTLPRNQRSHHDQRKTLTPTRTISVHLFHVVDVKKLVVQDGLTDYFMPGPAFPLFL